MGEFYRDEKDYLAAQKLHKEIRQATARAIKEALLAKRIGNYYPLEIESEDFEAVFKEYGI